MQNNNNKKMFLSALAFTLVAPLASAESLPPAATAASPSLPAEVSTAAQNSWATAPVIESQKEASEKAPLFDDKADIQSSANEYSDLLNQKKILNLKIEVKKLQQEEKELDGLTEDGKSAEDLQAELKAAMEQIETLKAKAESSEITSEDDAGKTGIFVTRIFGLGDDKSAVVYHENNISNLKEGEQLNSKIKLHEVTSNGAFFMVDGKKLFVPVTTIEYAQLKSFEREEQIQALESQEPASLLDIIGAQQ